MNKTMRLTHIWFVKTISMYICTIQRRLSPRIVHNFYSQLMERVFPRSRATMWFWYCTHRYRIWWCHAVVLRTPVQVVRRDESPALSSGHYEALTGPADYHPRGNGYNTFFSAIARGFQAKPVSNFPLLLRVSSPSPSGTHIPKTSLPSINTSVTKHESSE